MSIVVVILRAVSLLAFAAPATMGAHGRRAAAARGASQERRGSRAPVIANFASFVLFFALVFATPGAVEGWLSLSFAAAGALLAVCGAAIAWQARAALGVAWSLVPRASAEQALVATGPYRLVRHPIYLGLCLLALGEAVAFANVPAALAVIAVVAPSFLWRARSEEALLVEIFRESYLRYRSRTRALVPGLF